MASSGISDGNSAGRTSNRSSASSCSTVTTLPESRALNMLALSPGVTVATKKPITVMMSRDYNIRQVKFIIHTVGPVCGQHGGREPELLASCYTASLKLGAEHGCRSIAFPSISTGAYGYPVAEASQVALAAIGDFVSEHPGVYELIELVTFSERDERAYQTALRERMGGAPPRSGPA